jgi:hypothetical protein
LAPLKKALSLKRLSRTPSKRLASLIAANAGLAVAGGTCFDGGFVESVDLCAGGSREGNVHAFADRYVAQNPEKWFMWEVKAVQHAVCFVLLAAGFRTFTGDGINEVKAKGLENGGVKVLGSFRVGHTDIKMVDHAGIEVWHLVLRYIWYLLELFCNDRLLTPWCQHDCAREVS